MGCGMTKAVIPSALAIKSMRDSGFKDTAYAIAELVDNSIQATANDVKIIAIDEVDFVASRSRRRLKEIYILDNGQGMDQEVLEMALQFGNGTRLDPSEQTGIGKFGMGLPNASISQCLKAEVWSWQNSEVPYYTYLSVEKVQSGEMETVPESTKQSLPSHIMEAFSNDIGKSGTLIKWSGLDRVRWRTSKALFDNSELLIGRMYRNFINSGNVRVELIRSERDSNGTLQLTGKGNGRADVRPNDPLYLMVDTCAPEAPEGFGRQAYFEEFGEPVKVQVDLGTGEAHYVTIRFSIAKAALRKALQASGGPAGHTPIGRHCAKNIGVSVVRAGRELELNRTFDGGYDPLDRWWGIEVSFPPALDHVFGVPNNKQGAHKFQKLDSLADAEAEGMNEADYLESLREEGDTRVFLYEITKRITANLSSMRKQIKRVNEGEKKRDTVNKADPAVQGSSAATNKRKENGHLGDSDKFDELTPEEKKTAREEELIGKGLDPASAKEAAEISVQSNLKYIFSETPYDGYSFFSVSSRGGAILIYLNKNHPVSIHLFDALASREDDESAIDALKAMLCAWARMEDEATGPARQMLSDMRNDWGRMTRDFMSVIYDIEE